MKLRADTMFRQTICPIFCVFFKPAQNRGDTSVAGISQKDTDIQATLEMQHFKQKCNSIFIKEACPHQSQTAFKGRHIIVAHL